MASQDSAMENGEDFSKDVTTEIQENKVTRFQSNKNLEKTFQAEVSDDDCVLDSSDDEYFPPSQAAASDCDDTDGEIALNNGDKDQEDEDKESENGEDEDEESEVKATASGMTAKDGTQWAATSPIEHQAGRHNIVRERCGPNRNTNMLSNLDTFKLFFTPEMADIIIRNTNKKAISTYANYNEKNPEKKQLEWKNLELQEFYAFLAILITSGANNSNTDNVREMWQPYSYPLYRAAMSINRFWNIIRFIRFDDANTRAQRLENDKAAPIRDIWTMLNSRFSAKQKNGEFQWMEACRPRTHGIYPWALEICHLHLVMTTNFTWIIQSFCIVVSDLLKRPKQIIKDKEVDVKKATPKPDQFMMGRGRGSRGGRGCGVIINESLKLLRSNIQSHNSTHKAGIRVDTAITGTTVREVTVMTETVGAMMVMVDMITPPAMETTLAQFD
ncbi:hypothetical protein GWI33_007833 [Rhynchophorus ferrugineus]|uniref:PiggyBac transposable element-derived protein domain-containing protein n=1 Tax=Rhynchophorus ferrugineus TaxID=354439 RepID=A0A834IDN7_RHYFE|nr:hypothetical protein GWI33_007833 [Rhynchophorus ferrugineus]